MFVLKDALEALKSLSGYFNENNIRTRRNLRGDIERRSIAINEDFVESFKIVQEARIAFLFHLGL